MSKRFSGRNAVVTGASRGIGAAIAERLAADGANVAIAARTLDKHPVLPGSLNETLAKLNSYGGTHASIVADMGDPESREGLIAKAKEQLGGTIDILVNNAAAAIYMPLAEYPLRRVRLMMEINLLAPLDLTQQALPDMIEAGEAWVVNLSSATANYEPGPPYRQSELLEVMGIYGASKAALNRMTNAFSVETHKHSVRMNTVEPKAAVLSEGADIKVGEMLVPEQIESMEAMVEAAVFLCDCEQDFTGRVCSSLDLIEEQNLTVMTLAGDEPYPGGIRPIGSPLLG